MFAAALGFREMKLSLSVGLPKWRNPALGNPRRCPENLQGGKSLLRDQNSLKSRKVGEVDRRELEVVAAMAERPTHHPRAHLRALEGVGDVGLQVN